MVMNVTVLMLAVTACFTVSSLSDKYAVSEAGFSRNEFTFLMCSSMSVFLGLTLPFQNISFTLSWQSIAAILLIPLVAAWIVILVLGSKMKSVAEATQAASYIKGNLILTDSQDRYTHTTQTKQKVKSESSGSSRSSGNTTSGKF